LRDGGFAEYVMVPHPKYLFELGELDPAVACTFGCSGITTLSAVSKVMPLPPEEPVLLIGAGGLGLAAISMLKAYGHKAIVSVDIGHEKLAVATAAGATQTVNSSRPDVANNILAATGGPVIGVIDFVNNSTTAAMVNGLLAKGAKWVQVGVMGGSIELSLVGNIFRGLTIYSNITGNLEHLQQVMQLAKQGKLSPLPVQKMSWDSPNEAMELLQKRQGVRANRAGQGVGVLREQWFILVGKWGTDFSSHAVILMRLGAHLYLINSVVTAS
jgi:alcohol dehydrogenase/propanol-preferring alcohol dehydrogenase